MNFEKLGLLFLINYFNQLGEVKNHLLAALKEVLMAVQTSVDIVGQSATKKILGGQFDLLSPVFRQVQGVIQYSIDRVGPMTPSKAELSLEEGLKLKEHIVNSIISAIEDEIENTRGTTTEKAKLKIEALQTVKQVLQNQKNKSLVDAVEGREGREGSRKSAVA